jgi:heme exporter protein A
MTMQASIHRRIMRSMEATATLRGACVTLDDHPVLVDVDLDAGRGLTIVRGPNGAGKTTLLRAVAGLVPLARGSRRVASDLLYLGHRPGLHRALSATQNLSFFARYRGQGPSGVGAALASWRVNADTPVDRLSAGQRRRAALARIDVEESPVVLLDEPFAELDDEAGALLTRALERACAAGRCVLLATHGHPELAATNTVTLEQGRIA